MTQFIDALNWRYATKAYDPNKKLTADQVNTLIESVRLAPASFGLQSYRLIHVTNPEVREKLKAVSWNQTQVTDASDLFVLAVSTNTSAHDVDAFMQNVAATRNVPVESLTDYAGMIKGSIASRTPEQLIAWNTNQAYIALGILLSAAASEKIDATPMEGFDPKQYNEILGLNDHNLTSVLVIPVGYRAETDPYITMKKVRLATADLVIEK